MFRASLRRPVAHGDVMQLVAAQAERSQPLLPSPALHRRVQAMLDSQRSLAAALAAIPPAMVPPTGSTAEIIANTAFRNNRRGAGLGPVQAAHRLAAQTFAQFTALQSIAAAPAPEGDVPEAAARALTAAFGSVAAAQRDMALFCGAHVVGGGVTWVVMNPESKRRTETDGVVDVASCLEVVNTPIDVAPLSLGLYPLLALDITDAAYLATPDEWASVVQPAPKVAAWSRAARRKEQPPAPSLRERAFEPLHLQREAYTARLLASVDWDFFLSQLRHAAVYYTSPERGAARAARTTALEESAKDRVRAVLEKRVAEPEVEPEVDAKPAAKPVEEPAAAKEEAPVPEPEAAESPKAAEPEAEAPVELGAGQRLADGSLYYLRSDGAQEFHKPDGAKSVVHPDGRTVFSNPAKDYVTTTTPDGTTTFDYSSGWSIIQRPDGTSFNRSPEGSETEVKEEEPEPQPADSA